MPEVAYPGALQSVDARLARSLSLSASKLKDRITPLTFGRDASDPPAKPSWEFR